MFTEDRSFRPKIVLDLAKLKFLNCGVGQLSLHLAHALSAAKSEKFDFRLLVPKDSQQMFPDQQACCIPIRNWHRQRVRRWTDLLGIRCLPPGECHLWHWPHQDSEYWPPDPHVPVVLNILDLNFLYEGKSARKTRRRLQRLQEKVDRASCIVAISEFTAGEVRRHVRLGDRPVYVVPMGVTSSPPHRSHRPAFLPPGEFLYTIGDISPKKNFRVLLDLMPRLPEYRLVVAGRKTSGYAQAMQQEVQQRGLQQQVLMPGQINDDVRQWLYQNCSAFLFPSLAEGFGLPVIEAMKLGRPVFMSTCTSLPEVGGPLGFYWKNFEPDTLYQVFRDGMALVEQDSQYGDKLRAYAAQFSWQRAARNYLAIYESVWQQNAATHTLDQRVPRRCA